MGEELFYVMKQIAYDKKNNKARCFMLAKATYTFEQAQALEFLLHPRLKKNKLIGVYFLILKRGLFKKLLGKPFYAIKIFKTKKGNYYARHIAPKQWPYQEKFFETKWKRHLNYDVPITDIITNLKNTPSHS